MSPFVFFRHPGFGASLPVRLRGVSSGRLPSLAESRRPPYPGYVDIGPHRAPMLAALSRHAYLVSRIAELHPARASRAPIPSSLAALLSENARLTETVAALERRVASPEQEHEDDELAPVVHDESDATPSELLEVQLTKRDLKRHALLAFGVLMPIGMLVAFSLRALEPTPAPAARPPHDATTVRLTGIVGSRAGTIDARAGEHCEITIADSGDREAGRWCHIDVRCPGVNERFNAASCPIGEPKSPVRLQSNGIEIDELARRATFIAGWHGEVIQGGATLRLDAPRSEINGQR